MKIFSPQTFEAKVAMLCRGGCKRLRQRLQTFEGKRGVNWHRNRQSYSGHEKREERLTIRFPAALLQEISAETVLRYRKESAWEAFVDGLDVAEQFITSQSSLGTGNEIWWQLCPLIP